MGARVTQPKERITEMTIVNDNKGPFRLVRGQNCATVVPQDEWTKEMNVWLDELNNSIITCEHPIMRAAAELVYQIETTIPDDTYKWKRELFLEQIARRIPERIEK
jgi:hypothetical protein